MSADPVYTSDLSDEATFAWTMAIAVIRGPQSVEMARFQEAVRVTWGSYFDELPRSTWYPKYQKGLRDLSDLGLVELERTAEGSYEPRVIHEERLEKGKRSTWTA